MDPFTASANHLTTSSSANPHLSASDRPKNLYHVALRSDQMRACLGAVPGGDHGNQITPAAISHFTQSNNHFINAGHTAIDGGNSSSSRRERSVDSCLVSQSAMSSNQSWAPVRRKHPELVPIDVLKADFRHGDPLSGFTGTMFSSVCFSKPSATTGYNNIMTRSVTAAPRGRGTPDQEKHSGLHPDSAGKPKRSVSMSRLDQLSQPKRIYVAARQVKQSNALNKDNANIMTQSITSNTGSVQRAAMNLGRGTSRPGGSALRSRPRPKSMFVSSPSSVSSTPPGSTKGGLAHAKPTPPPKPKASASRSTQPTPSKITLSRSSDALEHAKKDTTPKQRPTTTSTSRRATPTSASKSSSVKETTKSNAPTPTSNGSRPPKKAVSMSSSMDKLSSNAINHAHASDINPLVEEEVSPGVNGGESIQDQHESMGSKKNESIQNVDLLSDLESAEKRQREEEEEAKARLAEKRRAAREEAERAAEAERQRLAEIARLEEEQRLREEEEQRRMEAETARLAEEHRRAEETKLQAAIEEEERRRKEEAERKAEEEKARIEKEERDRKAKEEADRARKDLEERLKKDEEERLARKLVSSTDYSYKKIIQIVNSSAY